MEYRKLHKHEAHEDIGVHELVIQMITETQNYITNYQTDLYYDIAEIIKKNDSIDNIDDKLTLYWLIRPCGTWLWDDDTPYSRVLDTANMNYEQYKIFVIRRDYPETWSIYLRDVKRGKH